VGGGGGGAGFGGHTSPSTYYQGTGSLGNSHAPVLSQTATKGWRGNGNTQNGGAAGTNGDGGGCLNNSGGGGGGLNSGGGSSSRGYVASGKGGASFLSGGVGGTSIVSGTTTMNGGFGGGGSGDWDYWTGGGGGGGYSGGGGGYYYGGGGGGSSWSNGTATTDLASNISGFHGRAIIKALVYIVPIVPIPNNNISLSILKSLYNDSGITSATGHSNLQSGPSTAIKLLDFRNATFTSGDHVPSSGAVSINTDFKGRTFGVDSFTQTWGPSGTERTGTIYTWNVPSTGNYEIEAMGAQGGSPDPLVRIGKAARMKATFPLQKDEVIKILVGQQGWSRIGNGIYSAGGGGGGTFVVKDAVSTSLNDVLIIAGGAGGAAVYYIMGPNDADAQLPGGNGYTGGATGGGNLSNAGWKGGGGGGLITDGMGTGTNYPGNDHTGGKSFVNGGDGGNYGYIPPRTTSQDYTSTGGFGGGGGSGAHTGGGGGGVYGGNAGWWHLDNGGKGGGSYVASSGTNQSGFVDWTNGHGEVIINRI